MLVLNIDKHKSTEVVFEVLRGSVVINMLYHTEL